MTKPGETPNGNAIKAFRNQKDLTQRDLAKKSGYRMRTIQRLEAGGRTQRSTLAAVAEVLGVKIDDIIISTIEVPKFAPGIHGDAPNLPPHFLLRPEIFDALRNNLLKGNGQKLAITGRQSVGVHGMGGLGKTVLAAALASLATTVDYLKQNEPELAERYLELAVFPQDEVIPESPICTLWKQTADITPRRVRGILADLHQLSLLSYKSESGQRNIVLHDLQYDYLRFATKENRKELHSQIVLAYQQKQQGNGWASVPTDGYFCEHLAYHLKEAKLLPDLRSLLLDFDWLEYKLNATDVLALLSDFARICEDPDLTLLRDVIRLSGHTLVMHKDLLRSQLQARLLGVKNSTLMTFRQRLETHAGQHAWLCSLSQCLDGPEGPLLRTLARHSSHVMSVVVSPDGKTCISTSGDRTLKIWDLSTGEEIRTLSGHSDGVNAVAISADGRTCVSGTSGQHTLKVWDLRTGSEIRTLTGNFDRSVRDRVGDSHWASDDDVRGLAIGPDGKTCVSASGNGMLKVWDLSTGEQIHTLRGHSRWVHAVATSLDGKTCVSASGDKTLKVWNLATGKEIRTLSGHSDDVIAVAMRADGNSCVSASRDRTLKVWDLTTGKVIRTLNGHTRAIYTMSATANGESCVSATLDGTFKIWDLVTGEETGTVAGQHGQVNGLAMSPNGKTCVCGLSSGYLTHWDLTTSKKYRRLCGHSKRVTAVAIIPGGKTCVSASRDGTLKVWDLAAGKEIRTLRGHIDLPENKGQLRVGKTGWAIGSCINAIAVNPHDNSCVSAASDGTLKVWDLVAGTEMSTLSGHSSWVKALAISSDGKSCVSAAADGEYKVWDLATSQERYTLTRSVSVRRECFGRSPPLSLSPNGNLCVTASSRNHTLIVWDLTVGKERHTLGGHTDYVSSVAISPDGNFCVSASSDQRLKVWDLDAGIEIHTLSGHSDGVRVVAISPDGNTYVSADKAGEVKIWDSATGGEIHTLNGHSRWIEELAISPDGKYCVSASWDRVFKIWDIATGNCVASFAADQSLSCCAVGMGGETNVCGDVEGRVHILSLCTPRRK